MANKVPVRILLDELGNPAGLAEFQPGELIDPAHLPAPTGGGGGAANTDELPEGLTNLYFTPARTLAAPLVGFAATTGAVVATDTVLVAIGKLQGAKEPTVTDSTATNYWNGLKGWSDFGGSVRAALLTGLDLTVSTAVVAGDTVLAGLGKLQAQVSKLLALVPLPTDTAKTFGFKPGTGWVEAAGGSGPEVPAVATPSNVAPAAGATNIATPGFSGSAYYSLYGKTQASRQARMSLNPGFSTILWDSGEIAGVGTTVTGTSLDGLVPTSTLVYWQIRYKDVDGAWSAWSAVTSFTTPTQYVPPVVGAAYGGGFYVGRVKDGADSYALIVAPKAAGEASSLQVKTTDSTTAGTLSTWDGAANTAAMIAAGAAAHPAASFCKGLTIGGYTDWVLPAKDQLELVHRQLKPDTTANSTSHGANPSSDPVGANYTAGAPAQTTVAAFKTGGAEAFAVDTYYWTSTEASTSTGWTWVQIFSGGFQYSNAKTTAYRVRAVRMVKI